MTSNSIHALAICTIFCKHLSFVISDLRCLQEMWSGPGVDEDEHLAIVSLNSYFKNGDHRIWSACGISFRKVAFIGLFLAEL